MVPDQENVGSLLDKIAEYRTGVGMKYLEEAVRRVLEKGENYFEEFSEDYKHALEKGFALKGQGELLYNLDYVTEYMGSHFIVLQSFLPKSVKGFNTASIVNFETREPVSFQGKIPALLEEIK